MGYYINTDSDGNILPVRKAGALLKDGAKEIDGKSFEENLVCVIHNFAFDAALYCDKNEYKYVINNPDERPKTWLVHPMAKELSGYK